MRKLISYFGLGWVLFGFLDAYASGIDWTSSNPADKLAIGISALFIFFVFIFPGLIIYGLFRERN